MLKYLIDFSIVAGLVIGITAMMGVITNSIGNHIFGRKKRSEFVNQSNEMIKNFKLVGGNETKK